MVSHQRLQHYRTNYCLLCITGLLGCRWKRYKQSTHDSRKRDLCWLTVLIVAFLYMLFYFYFWLVAVNDYNDFNWFIYMQLKSWYPWYKLLLGLTCAAFVYFLILMCLSLFHVSLGQQIYIYPVHIVLAVLTLAMCVTATFLLDNLWHSEWTVLQLSFQITGPFLHVGAVVLMTALTWLIAGHWLQLSHIVPKIVWLSVFVSVMVFLYICPLLINSPCVITLHDLPPRPQVIAHRGVDALAPENTMVSFEYAAHYDVHGYETDVRISQDGIPFLLHDSSLRRTTNVSDVFPERVDWDASWFNLSQLQSLDAGSWFLRDDPMNSVSRLNQSQRKQFSEQIIPTLEDLLLYAKSVDKTVMFDLFQPSKHHPYYNTSVQRTVEVILRSGIDQQKIWWLPGGRLPKGGENFTLTSHAARPISELRAKNFSNVNVQYDMISAKQISEYNAANITSTLYTVNTAWLFSLYWCSGASAVTSDNCHILQQVDNPVWHLTPQSFQILWIIVDVLSVVIVVTLFVVQRIRLYGTKFNPETLSLQSARTDNSYDEMYRSKTMKQKLLRMADQIEMSTDQRGGISNGGQPDGIHTMNGHNGHVAHNSVEPMETSTDIYHTEVLPEMA